MKTLYILLFFTVFLSCKTTKSIHIYNCKPINYGSEIRGQYLNKFFEGNNESRKIKIKNRKLTLDLNTEIDKLKNHLDTNGNLDKKMGIYYYAIIKDQDTLYSSSDLESWKYKDKVGLYRSDILKKHILR